MIPEEQLAMMQQQLPPQVTLEQVIAEYMDFAVSVKNDPNLNLDKKSQAMLQTAQALATLVPLASNDKEAELQLKAKEHEMNMQSKQQEMAMKRDEHLMKLQQSQADHNMKLQHAQENHQNSLVQSQQSHETKLKQANEEGGKKDANN